MMEFGDDEPDHFCADGPSPTSSEHNNAETMWWSARCTAASMEPDAEPDAETMQSAWKIPRHHY